LVSQCGASVASARKRGRKRHITLDVVLRVSERFGLGLPLKMALVLEKDPCVNLESWSKALKRNPQFVPPFEAAKADFYEKALRRLVDNEDPRWLCWVLEHRHPDVFGGGETSINVTQQIIGIPDDVLARAREYAKARKQ